MVNMLVSLLTGSFTTWFANKQEIDKLQAKARIENSQGHLSGYSDEYLIIIWSYPFISCFIPPLYESTMQGFERLALMPDWYVGGFISITFAVFGINKLFKWQDKKGGADG